MADLESFESTWLKKEMNRIGMSNQDLHQRLVNHGWEGTTNNISNWRKGQAQIPVELYAKLVKAFGKDPLNGDGLHDVLSLLNARFPTLSPYLKESPGSSKSDAKRDPRPVYLCRRGTYQGQRFIPYQDYEGNFVAGTSRFEQDKQTFPNMRTLVGALRANPELRVRMVPENSPRSAPSLIRQDSLMWE